MTTRSRISAVDIDLDRHEDNRPSPANLETFLPWACSQLGLTFVPIVIKVTISEPIHTSITRLKSQKKIVATVDTRSEESNELLQSSSTVNTADLVYVETVYDSSDHLIQLKFNKSLHIPVTLLNILSLIVKFHPLLTAIHINKGLNLNGLHQVNKIVTAGNISEVTLDNTGLDPANFYILLDNNSPVKYLSLARCKLDDDAVKKITSRLEYPSKASKTLVALNLSSNKITDEGAKYIANILRINRQLLYLNLSGNVIADAGAICILSTLVTFPLTAKEMKERKDRKYTYLRERKKFVKVTVENMRVDLENKLAVKRRASKVSHGPTKKIKSEMSEEFLGLGYFDPVWQEKAEIAAKEMFGPFSDAFNTENTTVRDGIRYCYGNNTLCYLNLAFNNLTYFSVQKLHEVMDTQHDWIRHPKGLINVCIEGNNIPVACRELAEIDYLIEMGLVQMQTTSTVIRKKAGSGRSK